MYVFQKMMDESFDGIQFETLVTFSQFMKLHLVPNNFMNKNARV